MERHSYPAEYLSFNICSAHELMFKAARVQKHLGVGVWGHIYPGWQKAWRYVKVFTSENQEDCPINLHSKTILTNLKCREEIFFKLCFKKRAIVTPGSGDTPYIMAPYGAGGPKWLPSGI